MKLLKRSLALLLCLVLVLSASATVFAAEITITGGADGSVYSAYMLLNATDGGIDEKGENLFAYTLNGKYTAILQAATGKTEAKDIIAYIDALDKEGIRAFANDVYARIKAAGLTADAVSVNNTFTDAAQGYYLIAETTTGSWGENQPDDTFTLVMLDTAGNESIEVATKEERPTLDKEITGDSNSIASDIAGDKKHDNVSIGSYVQFTLTAKVPSDAQYYDYYYFVINDTLSEGLTFVNEVIGEDDYKLSVSATGTVAPTYQLYTGTNAQAADYADGKTFQVALTNAKALAGQTVTVTYWAQLNEKAKIGEEDGNSNTADLIYSSDPNYDYQPDDNTPPPPKPDEDEDIPVGETPDVVTRTYTTGIKLLKVDQDGEVLTGAEFQITGENVVITLVSKEVFTEAENGAYYGLTDGTFTKDAPRAESQYVATEGATAGYVLIDGQYVAYDAEEHAGKTVYILYKANSHLYDGKKYNKSVAYEQKGEDQTETAVKAMVGVDGTVEFKGLGQGTYTITETKVPAGYNKIDDITLEITWSPENTATTDPNDCKWNATATVNGTATTLEMNADGLFELSVENQAGSELPGTGGIGTTLFYILGSVLVLAAVVMMITKKRMKSVE